MTRGEMFSSSTTSSQRYLTFTPHSRFIICLNLPQFSNIGDESSLFPSKILGIARQLSAWIDIHGIFKGCQFRAQVQSLNKTLDTKLDGIMYFPSLSLGSLFHYIYFQINTMLFWCERSYVCLIESFL